MDADAKELGHTRAPDRKTVWAYQSQNVIIHSCVGNSTPNRKFAYGSRVNSRSQSTPTRALSNRPQSRAIESRVQGFVRLSRLDVSVVDELALQLRDNPTSDALVLGLFFLALTPRLFEALGARRSAETPSRDANIRPSGWTNCQHC